MKSVISKLIFFLSLVTCLFSQFNFPFLPPKASFKTIAIPIDKNNFGVVVSVSLRSGWAIYWKHSGGVAQGTKFSQFKLPEKVQLDEVIYPTPSYKLTEDGSYSQIAYIHKKNTKFLLKFKVNDKNSLNKNIQGSFVVSYQACDDKTCDFPREEKINFSVVMDTKLADYATPVILEAKEDLPKKLPKNFKLKKEVSKNYLNLSFPSKLNIDKVYFFPDEQIVFDKKQTWSIKDNRLIELKVPFPVDTSIVDKGVLKIITKNNKTLSYLINEQSYKEENKEVSTQEKSSSNSLLYYLILAFIGGLILNLMPCVFPIIAIKVLGFVNQANKNQSHSFKYALAFSLGVLISFWVLAGIIIISKLSGGQELIWGFQLQNPFFMAFLITLLVIVSLNFFGVFEIVLPWTPQTKTNNDYLSSFSSGLLATIIATPCVAPFMSVALVAALSFPPLQAWLIFTFLGLGMSFPYLILSFFPVLLNWIPKPGMWLVTFKKVMGFLLLASAIWFMETFVNLLGIELFIKFALLLCIISCSFWYYGHHCSNRNSKAYKLSLSLLIITLISCTLILYNDIEYQEKLNKLPLNERQKEISKKSIFWEDFSEEKFQKFKSQKKKVFVDFTATWCASCIWNKKVVLEPNHKLFKEKSVVMLKADCTKSNHKFKKMLDKYNSTGVPMYLFFDGEKVHKLPNLLNQKIIDDILKD